MPLPLIPWLVSKLPFKKTEPLPEPHYPHLWTGGKFLGNGANGQTTLWTYIGPPDSDPKTSSAASSLLHSTPSTASPSPIDPLPHLHNRQIVLKTALDSLTLVAFKAEYYAMTQLLRRNESHLTKIITGIGDADTRRDRIYLEYCEGGDLEGEIKRRLRGGVKGEPEAGGYWLWKRKRDGEEKVKKGRDGKKLPSFFSEEELWRMLVCLAKGAVAMGRSDDEVGGRQFLHMDMHAANILIGKIGAEDHSCKSLKPQYKIADFGVVMEWNSKSNEPHDDPDGIDARQNIAAEIFHMEDFHPSAPYPTLGEKCNVWGIGITMYQALLLSLKPPQRHDPPEPTDPSTEPSDPPLPDRYKSDFGAPDLPSGYKYGRLIEKADRYSEELRVTIQHCLMEDYRERISSRELLRKAEGVVGEFERGEREEKGDGGGGEGGGKEVPDGEWVWMSEEEIEELVRDGFL